MRTNTSNQADARMPVPRPLAFVLAAALWAAIFASYAFAAQADPFEITEASGNLTRNAEGDPAVQAGSHPFDGSAFIRVASHMVTDPNGFEIEAPNGNFKNVITTLPPGVVGTPLAVEQCSRAAFNEALPTKPSKCPDNSAVGWAKIKPNWAPYELFGPVYNLKPAHGQPALFGFRISSATVYLQGGLKTGPEPSVTISSIESSQGLPILYTEVTLWGTPADPAHDAMRGNCLTQSGPTGELCPSTEPVRPMVSMPTSCSGPLKTTLASNSWLEPESWTQGSFVSTDTEGNPVGIEDCATLAFDPDMQTAIAPKSTSSPASLDVDLSIPQNNSVQGRVTSHLKKAVVEFPAGVSLNSASADGLEACSLAQVGLNESAPTSCPAGSRIGTVEVTTPLLEGPLDGSLYLARQYENPFNSMYAVYLVIDDPAKGIYVKTPGRIDVNPQNGQITSTFDNSPQVPFDRLKLQFASGPRSPMKTPDTCGTYTTRYTLTSWSGKTVQLSDSFTVNQNCERAGQFTPGFAAGTANPVGGKFSAFNLRLTREDGQQNLASIAVAMPEGLTAKLAGVPLCPDDAAATGACPAASQIGTTTVGSGAGPSPLYVPQPGKAPTALYLAGPYKGAPYSLIAKVPAQAGPFDLGTVVVRNTINVDRTTAQVTVQSDPLPQILQGIPISYRDVRVEVNRPEFTLNPTSCNPMAIGGSVGSAAGAVAQLSSRFQATDCANLAFKPHLKLSLKGKMKRGGNPALKAVMTQPRGGANIDKVQVILPKTAFIDNAHINNPCTRAQYDANACPPKSILGTVTAHTPLLDQPLTGKVYFRSNGGERELPDIVAALRGQIAIDLVGYIDSVVNKKQNTSRVRTTFAMVPDAPVTRFEMKLKGGKVGLIENSANLCKVKNNRATVKMNGQNGRIHDTNPVLSNSCGKKSSGRNK